LLNKFQLSPPASVGARTAELSRMIQSTSNAVELFNQYTETVGKLISINSNNSNIKLNNSKIQNLSNIIQEQFNLVSGAIRSAGDRFEEIENELNSENSEISEIENNLNNISIHSQNSTNIDEMKFHYSSVVDSEMKSLLTVKDNILASISRANDLV
jgi:hypothetical protein